MYYYTVIARMAELVDAADSKSAGSDTVRVQVPLLVPVISLLILKFPFIVSFDEINSVFCFSPAGEE